MSSRKAKRDDQEERNGIPEIERAYEPKMVTPTATIPQNQKEVDSMSTSELEAKCRELRQIQTLIDEAQAEAEAIKDAIKAQMGQEEEMRAGEYRITWKPVETVRLDSTALRKAAPMLYELYAKKTTVRRFCVA